MRIYSGIVLREFKVELSFIKWALVGINNQIVEIVFVMHVGSEVGRWFMDKKYVQKPVFAYEPAQEVVGFLRKYFTGEFHRMFLLVGFVVRREKEQID